MTGDSGVLLRHQLDFTLYSLPATTVRIDFPVAAEAEIMMLAAMPTIRIGANYVASAIVINSLVIQPRRLQFEIANPPALLPIALQVLCRGPFVFGWLRVPETVQTVIATAAQQIRIVGPSYWAVPLGPGLAARDPGPGAAAASPAPSASTARPDEGERSTRSDQASAGAAAAPGGTGPGTNSTAAKPAEKPAARSAPASPAAAGSTVS